MRRIRERIKKIDLERIKSRSLGLIKNKKAIAVVAVLVIGLTVSLVLAFAVFPGEQKEEPRLNVKIYDRTQKTSSKNLLIWLNRMGYWGPDLTRGWNGTSAGPLIPNIPQVIRILPDGQTGKEFTVGFVYTLMMKSGSDKDAIIVELYDDKVVVSGTPIPGKRQEFKRS